MDQAIRKTSVFPSGALSLLFGIALAGCGGGDGDSASAPKPSNNAPAQTGTSASNTAPTITGTAITAVVANAAYSFSPVATDPDGDGLAFQIQNKPAWATFDTVSGKLSGQPTLAHTGDYPNIIITVNDGKASASLTAFSVKVNGPAQSASVSLGWVAPSAHEDGSVLTNLAGYMIVYGASNTSLDKSIRIDNPGIDQYVIDGLPAGTYYFGVKAFTSTGLESATSNIVSRTIG